MDQQSKRKTQTKNALENVRKEKTKTHAAAATSWLSSSSSRHRYQSCQSKQTRLFFFTNLLYL